MALKSIMAGVVMTADTKKFESGVKQAANAADKAGKQAGGSFAGVQGAFDRAAASAKKMAVAFAGAFASVSAVKNIASAMTSTEQAISKLSAATADLSSARALFEDLNGLSREIPQSFDDITDAAVALNKAGIAPTHSALKSLAALAIGTNSSLAGVTSAISSAALGRTQGLKQLGIVAKDVGDGLEVTFRGVTEKIGKSGDDITAYVAKIADSNFAQTLAIQMDGLTGSQKRLGEAWGDFWRQVAESGVGDLIKGAMDLATDAVDGLTAALNSETFRKILADISSFFQTFGDYCKDVFEGIGNAWDSFCNIMPEWAQEACGDSSVYFSNFFALVQIGLQKVTSTISLIYQRLSAVGEYIGSSFSASTQDVMNKADEELRLTKALVDAGRLTAEQAKKLTIQGLRKEYGLMGGDWKKLQDEIKERNKNIKGADPLESFKDALGRSQKEYEEKEEELINRILQTRKNAEDRAAKLNSDKTSEIKFAEPPKVATGTGAGTGKSGGAKAAESKINTAALDALKRQLQAAEDARKDAWAREEEEYTARLAVLDEFHNNGILKEQEFGDLHAQVVEAHNAKITELMDAHYAEERAQRLEQQRQLQEIENEFGFGTDTAISAFGDKLTKFGISWDSFLTGMSDQSKMTMSQIAGVYSKGSQAVSSYFGSLASGLDESSTEYKALFALQKGFAVASATMSVISGAAEAFKLGFPQGLVVMAQVLAQGMALVGQIKSVNFSGAYDKGGVIPSGSVGLVGEYGPELISGPATITSRRDTADALKKSGDITVNVIEDASRAGQVSKEKTDEGEIINIVVANIRSGGGVSDAIGTAYGLSRRGQ